jgi:hypothetical protein
VDTGTTRLLSLVALLGGGCATGLGPGALRGERPDYNQQIVRSADAEMLLNLVRLRYNDSPLFLELGTIVAQYSYDGSVAVGGQISGSGPSNATVGTSLGYSEKPTVTWTPLAGEEFATRMLAPIPLDAIMLYEQTGWRADRLFLLTIQRVNDLFNAPTASGPTPDAPPDYVPFADFAERFHRLRSANLAGLNWEKREGEKEPPGRNPRFWVRAPADARSALNADVAALRRYLDLEPQRNDFVLTEFPFERRSTEVGMRPRSLLGVMYFLSQAVEPPEPDVAAGHVTVTKDAEGRPFDWSRVTGRVMAIHSQKDRPTNAYVAVRYRGWWFWVADDDHSSKATFSLVNTLFSLQAATGKGRTPLLTLPVGR